MARKSVDNPGNSENDKACTKAVEFFPIPAVDANLMAVNPGLEGWRAESAAGALESCVLHLLTEAVQDGMDSSTAYLCRFALEAAAALREASHGGIA